MLDRWRHGGFTLTLQLDDLFESGFTNQKLGGGGWYISKKASLCIKVALSITLDNICAKVEDGKVMLNFVREQLLDPPWAGRGEAARHIGLVNHEAAATAASG